MTLDLVSSQRLVEPTPWEMERFRAAPKHEREDWHDVLDRASAYRWDDSVLRVIESEARREEHVRRRWFMPVAAMCGGPRPNVFRALFQKDIGGVSGVSDSWFDASYYVLDGVSGKVSDFVDYIDPTHTLRQATSANQCAVPSAVAAMNNALCVQGTGVEFYTSTRAPSAWKYLHDGGGAEHRHVFIGDNTSVDQTLHSTCNVLSGSTSVGSFTETSFAAGNLLGGLFVTNGTTSPANGRIISASGFIVQSSGSGNPTYIGGSYLEGSGTDYIVYVRGSIAVSGSTTGVPAASDPSFTLRLFQNYSTTLPFKGRWRAGYFVRRVLSAAHRTIVQQWIQKETGIAP